MKGLIICDEGFEDIVAQTFTDKYNIEAETEPTIIKFQTETYEKIGEICYTFQSAIKILSDYEEFGLSNINYKSIAEKFENNLNSTIPELKFETVKITCVRKGNHNFKSTQIAEEFSKHLLKEKQKTYKTSDIEIFIYIKDNKGYIGIDFSGRNLSKRDYRIFLGSDSIRATLAYNLLKYAEYNKEEFIIDPFMGSGTIPIEAGLESSKTSPFFFSKEKFLFQKFLPDIKWKTLFNEIDAKRDTTNKQIYGYDSLLKYLKHSQKNAKIADINKVVNLSKVEVDWIDTKVNEEAVDKIITQPPIITEHGSKTKILKTYKELFNRSKDILKPNALIVILLNEKNTLDIKEIAKNYNYKLINEKDVYEGQDKKTILKLKFNK